MADNEAKSVYYPFTPLTLFYYVWRTIFVLINNLYAIPAYMIWMVVLQPLGYYAPWLYWKIEGKLYKWLLRMVGYWMYSSGYTVVESGEDLTPLLTEECLVLCNHQSTGDVPTLMYYFQDKPSVLNNILWIIDYTFKFTNFGCVSQSHGDFFIRQGKDHRDSQLSVLKNHIEDVYIGLKRKWIVVFPEGGFLRKRREGSQVFAKKNNYPVLEHVTLPRIGAVQTILDTTQLTNGYVPNGRRPIKWIIDLTIGYPDRKPLDIMSAIWGFRRPCKTSVHCRIFPADQVPRDSEGLLQWVYNLYENKETLLDQFYKTGAFPKEDQQLCYGTLLSEPKEVKYTLAKMISIHAVFLISIYIQYHFIKLLITSVWSLLSLVL